MSVERRWAELATPLLAVVIAMLAGCAESREELWRLTSPDGRVDAVFVEIAGGGATVDFAYNLFFVPAGGSPQGGHPVLVADRIANLHGRWAGIKRFEVNYDAARIFNFFNFWHSGALDDWKYVVEIRLVPRKDSQLDAAVHPLRSAPGVTLR